MQKKYYIFFRDDDVYKLDKKFTVFFNLFLKNKIPVIYGIIPGKLEDDLREFLLYNKNNTPALLDIVQHGWIHKNYNAVNLEKKYEFGEKRAYLEQKKDILNGWLRLYGAFKDKFTPAFIPPYHSYDFTTLKIINELGQKNNLQIFSIGNKTFPKNKYFLDIPAQINFPAEKHTNREKTVNNFINHLFNNFRNSSVVGILLHHDTYDKNNIADLKQILNLLRRNKSINFILFSDLLKNKKTSKFDLTIEITNRCNLKCKICNIWKEAPKKYLSFRDIEKSLLLLSRGYSLSSVSLTGGEPFLNPEINKIYTYLYELKTMNIIESIGIYSNGYLKNKILDFLENQKKCITDLDMGISIDGTEIIHNSIRGRSDAYSNSIKLLNIIRLKYPQVKLAVKFTINPINVSELWKIYLYCKKKKITLIPKFFETNAKFYYHKASALTGLTNIFTENNKKTLKKVLLDIYNEGKNSSCQLVDINIIKLFIEFIDTGYPPAKECYTPIYSLFINANGDIHPCLYMPAVANINKKNWMNNIFNELHLKHCQDAISGSCPKCLAYHGFLKNINLG